MEKLTIFGGKKLCGSLEVDSAKNAILPIMAASILCDGKVVLKKCPNYLDITNMQKILEYLGMKTNLSNHVLTIDTNSLNKSFIPHSLAKELRSSIFTLGALLAKTKSAKIAYPGGCDIGLRPIDLHLKGLKDLNVKITERHGYIHCDATNIKSGTVNLDFPSVGATENIMMAAVFCSGTSFIINAAKEPEIVDLQNFLNKMGAKISGAGTSVIKIEGVNNLHSGEYTPISDRIIAGTYLLGAAITGGEIELLNTNPKHFSSLVHKLSKSGCKIKAFDDKITLRSSKRLKAVDLIETSPYPGFPTDLQAQFLTFLSVVKGCSCIKENLFETRFKFVPELVKMGASIKVYGQTAYVCGVKKLEGADVFASDLRGGASLVLAGLCAEGYTTVHNIFHIDRGYDRLEEKLNSLGASIKREEDCD